MLTYKAHRSVVGQKKCNIGIKKDKVQFSQSIKQQGQNLDNEKNGQKI